MRSSRTKEKIENRIEFNNLFVKTAGSFAEHLVTIESIDKIVTNVFGRAVKISNAASLSYLHGLAVSGIRCAAMLEKRAVKGALQTIKNMARQHVPMTIVIGKGAMPLLPEMAQTGAVIFQAFNAQSLADRILHAQVVAEKSLVPVIVLAEYNDLSSDFLVPSRQELINFFGDPDNFSNVKSAAQAIVFGNKRKRVPNWTNPDAPLAVGIIKNDTGMAFETAAKAAFSKSHIQDMIDDDLFRMVGVHF